MLGLLGLIPALPLAGFLILALAGGWLSRRWAAIVGVGSVALAAIVALLVGIQFLASPPPGYSYTQTLWVWMNVNGFTPGVSFYLDALSLIMVLVVTFVSALIHLYSAEFMQGEGYSRFFAYMNLFVGSMLILVLADNLLLLYLGWEGVGLCSYLLIGFWYQDPVNGRAARKAFVVTRVGDAALAVGLFLLYTQTGTLQIQGVMQQAALSWPVGSALAVASALLLLGGAVGKSAQLPLQTWLPDAMAGPTPVSALIHAATMVTAGVYLIARTHVLFTLAPWAQGAVAVIGAITLLLAGCSALAQWDIKRVLAYSTISQIGYMFLALGVGAWSAAILHFMVHAFFKSLLFLAAGVVIISLHEEHDIHKMGGLRRELPVTFWTFLIGAASLAALPFVTAGFYSKDLILFQAWAGPRGNPWLWLAGLIGAFITSVYIFRVVWLVFYGEVKEKPAYRPGPRMQVPLIVLAALSVVDGFVELPKYLGDLPLFTDWMQHTLPPMQSGTLTGSTEAVLEVVAPLVSLVGIYLAYVLFLRQPGLIQPLLRTSWGSFLQRFWLGGWGFDGLYDRLLVRPYVWVARVNKDDVIDLLYKAIAWLARAVNLLLGRTQSGQVRWYALGIAIGAVILVAIGVAL